jgi:hypothetical protein
MELLQIGGTETQRDSWQILIVQLLLTVEWSFETEAHKLYCLIEENFSSDTIE